MTRLRGMLWKTPWKRNRPEVASVPVPMWFFSRFGRTGGIFPSSEYQTPASSPAPGDGLPPFWIGMIGAFDLALARQTIVPGQNVFVRRGWVMRDFMSSIVGSVNALEARGQAGTTSIVQSFVPQIGADIRAIVSLMTVEPDGANVKTSLYVDGVLFAQQVGAYTASPFQVVMSGEEVETSSPQPYIHGWAGGNALPTLAEIQQWFLDSRYNLEIAAIPGKTSDRFSATSVAPAAPAALPNLAGGQVMNYVVNVPPDPVALNTLLNVTFAY